MLRTAFSRTAAPTLKKLPLVRQLGIHKWTDAENHVQTKYGGMPGRYIVSRAAGVVFCIDVFSGRNVSHVMVDPENVGTVTVDLTKEYDI